MPHIKEVEMINDLKTLLADFREITFELEDREAETLAGEIDNGIEALIRRLQLLE